MTRTVVYARRQTALAPTRTPAYAGVGAGPQPALPPPPPSGAAAGGPPGGGPPSGEDGYLDKLVKYVPAEVVAVFAPTAAVLGNRHGLLIALAIVCLLATPGYLFLTAQNQPANLQPLPHYYVLATIAFVAWALGVSQDLDKLFGLDGIVVAFILTAAVVLIPLVDGLLAKLKI